MSTLEKSREATDMANIRAAYAEAMVGFLDTKTTEFPVYAKAQKMVQAEEGWDHIDWPEYLGSSFEVKSGDEVYVVVNDDATIEVTKTEPTSGTDYTSKG